MSEGQGQAAAAASTVTNVFVAALMSAFLLPLVIDEVMAVDVTSWTGGSAQLWDILPVMIVLAVFIYFTHEAINTGGSS